LGRFTLFAAMMALRLRATGAIARTHAIAAQFTRDVEQWLDSCYHYHVAIEFALALQYSNSSILFPFVQLLSIIEIVALQI
jgi:hypothetical protein